MHISLGGMEAIHIDWHNGVPARGNGRISADQARNMDLTPQAITAFMPGLNNKMFEGTVTLVNVWASWCVACAGRSGRTGSCACSRRAG